MFIYWFEDEQQHGRQVQKILTKLMQRGDSIVTSTVTLGEVQVRPLRMGKPELARRFRAGVIELAEIIAFDAVAADHYARLRENSSVRGADALQLACAAAFGVELFITNDKRLHGLRVPGIHFIVPLDRVPI